MSGAPSRRAAVRLATAAFAAASTGNLNFSQAECVEETNQSSGGGGARPTFVLATSAAMPTRADTAVASIQQRKDTIYVERETDEIDLDKVRDAIRDVIAADAEARGDGTSLAGTMLRLAFVSSSSSCPSQDAGIRLAQSKLESIRSRYPEMGLADLYAFAGVVAIEMSGGPKIPFRLGRQDAKVEKVPDHSDELAGLADLYAFASENDVKIPGGPQLDRKDAKAEKVPEPKEEVSDEPEASIKTKKSGCIHDRGNSASDRGSPLRTVQHLRETLGERFQLTDAEMVALMGGHTLGRCHTGRSGYWGPWSPSEDRFSNDYFTLLLHEFWSPKRAHNGRVWLGPAQYANMHSQTVDGVSFGGGSIVRLPVDFSLLVDPELRKWAIRYAEDQELFFKNFATAFAKVINAGTPAPPPKPWYKFW